MKNKKQQINNEFRRGIKRTFGNLVEYAFFSGRFAYNTAEIDKSDIDIIIVLKNEFESVDNKIAQRIIKKAVTKYLEIHEKYGYKPDLLFPGEYVTSRQIEDSLAGRGYHINERNIYLPIVCSEDYWNIQENEYRAWRSMSAFNNRELIIGNEKLFQKNRRKAWVEIIKFLFLEGRKLTPEKIFERIINGGEGYLGICKDYEPEFSKQELYIVKKSLQYLENQGFVINNQEENYTVVENKLNSWQEEIINRLRHSNWNGKHIVDWNNLRTYVKDTYGNSKSRI
ncbi:MAG: hypothetical protein NC827_08245 [Candidatus Omnitrophica bacterium]|nr:hypothetical protein [Candidatus Omnitrophota bacterium]